MIATRVWKENNDPLDGKFKCARKVYEFCSELAIVSKFLF